MHIQWILKVYTPPRLQPLQVVRSAEHKGERGTSVTGHPL